MSEPRDTAGNPIWTPVPFCECGKTGGCEKCNPFYPFWNEDIELAEVGMDEYGGILLDEDDK